MKIGMLFAVIVILGMACFVFWPSEQKATVYIGETGPANIDRYVRYSLPNYESLIEIDYGGRRHVIFDGGHNHGVAKIGDYPIPDKVPK